MDMQRDAKKSTMQFIFKLLEEDTEDLKRQEKEKVLELKELDTLVGGVETNEALPFMQVAQPMILPTSPSHIHTWTSSSSTQQHADWVTSTRDRLFQPPYRLGRVFTLSGSASGTAWIPALHFVITCAHIVHKAQGEPLFFLLPDDRTVISLSIVFSTPEAQVTSNYKFDVACLKMEGVVGSSQSLHDIPLAAFAPGSIDWTGKCITVGILKPYSSNARNMSETQKMLNEGRVESVSSSLVTVSARADSGFSGGPIINTSFEIVGMVQGGEGDFIKTVKMIPIHDLVRDLCVISYFVPGLSPFQLHTGVGGTTF